MKRAAQVERKVALPVVGSCKECSWLEPCGGYHDSNRLFGNTCFERFCCGGKAGCNYLCPANPDRVRMLNEVEGLRFGALPPIVQGDLTLPAYIPSVLHHSSRERPLDIPFAAVPPKEVFRKRGERMVAVAKTGVELRQRLLLAPATRVVLNCIQPDNEIERLWEFWVQDDIPAQLASLGIDAVIVPNFSHFRNVPRTEILGNRMRHLICARDLQAAGLTAVPHLSVVDPQDWDFWRVWLRRNPGVRFVAFEFETGYKSRVDGEDAITRLTAVRNDVGRNLHLIVVGGTQYLKEAYSQFPSITFIDASPFWKTVCRRRARLSAGQLAWGKEETLPKEMLDERFAHNFGVYTESVQQRLHGTPTAVKEGRADRRLTSPAPPPAPPPNKPR